tara:strand:+ start:31026 stop:31691 length:666 start_codon:yes stop_codon:yes gene_type:complete
MVKEDHEYVFKNLTSKKDKNNLKEFLRYQTTAEYGGYQIFDGTRTHLLHVPEELSDFIFFLKQYEKKKTKIKTYLEIGFSTGKTNTILNKFFNFKQIVAVDNFSAHISTHDLWANLMRKNLVLLTGNSENDKIINNVKKFAPFDLIFIDGSHDYKDIKNDLNVYAKFLSNNGILAVHDIKHKDYPGVNKAWTEFKSKNDFKIKEISCKNYFFNCGVGIATK